jgi:hypothetical protein
LAQLVFPAGQNCLDAAVLTSDIQSLPITEADQASHVRRNVKPSACTVYVPTLCPETAGGSHLRFLPTYHRRNKAEEHLLPDSVVASGEETGRKGGRQKLEVSVHRFRQCGCALSHCPNNYGDRTILPDSRPHQAALRIASAATASTPNTETPVPADGPMSEIVETGVSVNPSIRSIGHWRRSK